MSTGSQQADLPPMDVAPLWPLSLTVSLIGGLLNAELADDPVYDGLELQWFDDDTHGTGMLAFLSRRSDRTVDYYPQRGLRIAASGYEIGGGTRSWTETDFEVARWEVADDGVDADVRFTDVDGRLIEVHVHDRDGRRRRRGELLAPVGSGIDRPAGLLLVWLGGFDLVRVTGRRPVFRIDGRDAATGRLPGSRLHRRHLIKYAAPVCVLELNHTHDGPLTPPGPEQELEVTEDGSGLAGITVRRPGHRARVRLEPALPDLRAVPDGSARRGRWHMTIDDARLTGGTWSAARSGVQVALRLEVDEAWRPGRLPWLVRLVTTVVPLFRRWPTTYRWRAAVDLEPAPAMTAGWERTTSEDGQAYRRATRS